MRSNSATQACCGLPSHPTSHCPLHSTRHVSRSLEFCWLPRLRRGQKETYPRFFWNSKSCAGLRPLPCLPCWGIPLAERKPEGPLGGLITLFYFWLTRHTRDWGILRGSLRPYKGHCLNPKTSRRAESFRQASDGCGDWEIIKHLLGFRISVKVGEWLEAE